MSHNARAHARQAPTRALRFGRGGGKKREIIKKRKVPPSSLSLNYSLCGGGRGNIQRLTTIKDFMAIYIYIYIYVSQNQTCELAETWFVENGINATARRIIHELLVLRSKTAADRKACLARTNSMLADSALSGERRKKNIYIVRVERLSLPLLLRAREDVGGGKRGRKATHVYQSILLEGGPFSLLISTASPDIDVPLSLVDSTATATGEEVELAFIGFSRSSSGSSSFDLPTTIAS